MIENVEDELYSIVCDVVAAANEEIENPSNEKEYDNPIKPLEKNI
ncbi:MAG: hypothetical protein XD84_0585 [Desulfotomaculum sp. 46_80]|nr:MAG: hypothetical protein XD84_0585 [Desulfotomaculum sp. 46_80]